MPRSTSRSAAGGIAHESVQPCSVQIPAGKAMLAGDLMIPAGARGIVVFAHGSGSSRHSARNRYVAGEL
jgi:putative phosphoribosyl transferase